jgi:SAM-dependent methyltransferase
MAHGRDAVGQALAGVKALYTGNLAEHGVSSAAVGWPDPDAQRLRFEKLALVLRGEQPVSVADYGCGYAAMLDFLNGRGTPTVAHYRGYDISAEMLEAARERVGGDPRVELVNSGTPDAEVDYSFVSGTFNVRMSASEEEWRAFVLETLVELWDRSRRGVAFNLLTSYVDWRKDDLFYAPPEEFFAFCKNELSRFVTLVHDYPLYEWTLLVHREGP